MSTQWTPQTSVQTLYTVTGMPVTTTVGTLIGLLGLTRQVTTTLPGGTPTIWNSTGAKPTDWNADLTPSAGIILFQDGTSYFLLQNGIDTLGLQ
jgi:hypothetical protein